MTLQEIQHLYNSSNYEVFEKGNFIFFKEENSPMFENLSVDNKNVKPGDSVRINVAASDDTKLLDATMHYIAPTSKNENSILLSYDSSTNSFIGDFLIDEDSEIGIWKVDSIEIRDTNQNITLIQADKTDLSNGEFNVLDVTVPLLPTVNEVTDKSTSVIGTAEAGSSVTVKTGEMVIGTGTATIEGKYSVTILKQKADTKLTVISTDAAGNTSEAKEVTVKDVTAPVEPTVNEITDKSVSVTGVAEAGSSINVKAGTTIIGTGTATNEGKYSFPISKQQAGIKLSVTATDGSGNISLAKEVTVKDVTAPTLPVVNEVTDTSTSVSGVAEVESLITIKTGNMIIGTGITSIEGKYLVTIPQQKEGTKLAVTTTDAAGNKSDSKEVTVKDVIAPTVPTVNEVTDKSISVTGAGEASSSITVKTGTTVIGTGTTTNEGKYLITILKQKAYTKLQITATDASGNISLIKEVTVKDVTAPTAPAVNEVSDTSASVTGTAEAGSLITIKEGTMVIGTGITSNEGKYLVTIPKQTAGTKLTVTATDAAENNSDTNEVTVKDVTAPTVPTVNEVTDKSINVNGTAEEGSSITVKAGTTIIGTGTTSNEGKYSVVISKQKANTKLAVTATDGSGNISIVKEVTVIDVTAPTIPDCK